jgi:hypothetical protein
MCCIVHGSKEQCVMDGGNWYAIPAWVISICRRQTHFRGSNHKSLHEKDGANSMYAIGKYTRSLCATGPTCHTHKKCTYMPLNGTQGMSIKSDGIPGIFPKGWPQPFPQPKRCMYSLSLSLLENKNENSDQQRMSMLNVFLLLVTYSSWTDTTFLLF